MIKVMLIWMGILISVSVIGTALVVLIDKWIGGQEDDQTDNSDPSI